MTRVAERLLLQRGPGRIGDKPLSGGGGRQRLNGR